MVGRYAALAADTFAWLSRRRSSLTLYDSFRCAASASARSIVSGWVVVWDVTWAAEAEGEGAAKARETPKIAPMIARMTSRPVTRAAVRAHAGAGADRHAFTRSTAPSRSRYATGTTTSVRSVDVIRPPI